MIRAIRVVENLILSKGVGWCMIGLKMLDSTVLIELLRELGIRVLIPESLQYREFPELTFPLFPHC